MLFIIACIIHQDIWFWATPKAVGVGNGGGIVRRRTLSKPFSRQRSPRVNVAVSDNVLNKISIVV